MPDPSGSGLISVGSGGVEGNRGTRRMPANEIDDAFEQLQPALCTTDNAAHHNALPTVRPQGGGHHRFRVILPVEAEGARLSRYAVVGELAHAYLDGVGDGLRIPGARDPVGVQADHEHAWLCCQLGHPPSIETGAAWPKPPE